MFATKDLRSDINWPVIVGSALLFFLAVYLCFSNLSKSISLSDESLHVKVVQEMYHSGQWWLPTLEGEPYFRKPPFKMWLSFIPLFIFGESNFSYRLIDACLGVTFVMGLLAFGTYVFRNFWIGFTGALLLLLNRAFLVSSHGYRHATQDPMLHVLQFVAMILFFFWWQRFQDEEEGEEFRFALTYGVLIGLSVLTKNVLGFVAPGLAFLFLLLRRELVPFITRFPKEIILALGVSLMIPLFYMLPHFMFTPSAFENLFMSEVVQRASTGEHNVDRPWYYFEKLYRWEFIPIPFILSGILFALYSAFYKREPLHQYLLIWAVTPILVFSLVQSRLLWYISDSYPAITLLFGSALIYGLNEFYRSRFSTPRVIMIAIILTAALWRTPAYFERAWNTATRTDRRIELDRAMDVIQGFKNAKILVYAPEFRMDEKYKCRVEKIYLGMPGDRVKFAYNLDEFLAEAANSDYTFAIAPRDNLAIALEQFKPKQFMKLQPVHHRNQKVFLLSRVDTGSPLFRKSSKAT